MNGGSIRKRVHYALAIVALAMLLGYFAGDPKLWITNPGQAALLSVAAVAEGARKVMGAP